MRSYRQPEKAAQSEVAGPREIAPRTNATLRSALTTSLIALGLAALSCGHVGVERSAPPSVDAGPPERALALRPGQPEQQPVHMSVASDELDTLVVTQVLAELRRRHTAMPHRELPELAITIVREASRHNLDPALVMAVIEVESSFYHRAVSSVGALGLMQLLPSTAQEIAEREGLTWRGADSLFDPLLNVKLGTAYLKELELRFEDLHTALAAYNWGPGRIQRRLKKGRTLPVEYIRRVMSSYDEGELQASST